MNSKIFFSSINLSDLLGLPCFRLIPELTPRVNKTSRDDDNARVESVDNAAVDWRFEDPPIGASLISTKLPTGVLIPDVYTEHKTVFTFAASP